MANVDISPLKAVWATDIVVECPLYQDPNMSAPELLALELQNLLDCVEVYGLDYMHGMAKKYYVKRARMALAKYKEQAQ